MNVTTPQFLLFAIAAIVLLNISKSRAFRRAALFAANIFFAACFIRNWFEIIPLLLILAYGYLLALYAYKENRTKVAYAGIAVMIAAFIYIKGYPITSHMPKLPFDYVVVGLSYMLFRMIHLALDISTRSLKEKISVISYFNYVCSFLTFTSGPIQRYQDFAPSERGEFSCGGPHVDVVGIFSRIASGFFKISVLAVMFQQVHQGLLSKLADPGISGGPSSLIVFAVCAGAYTLYLYFNFSGYMDIVAGLGRLMGFELPENFKAPFGAGNFLEFWSRWHITLSEWFRIYMFNPLLKQMIRRWNSPKALPYLGAAAYFATFVTLGAWHGTIYVGLFLGLGACANKLYEIEITKRLGRKTYRKMSRTPMLRYINRGLVFGYISLSITCLWTNIGQFIHLMRSMGILEVGVSILALSAAASIFYVFANFIMKLYARTAEGSTAVLSSPVFRQVWLAVKIIVVAVLIAGKFGAAAEVAYKVF